MSGKDIPGAFRETEKSAKTDATDDGLQNIPIASRNRSAERFRKANLSDDSLFTICMRNREFCRAALSIILETDFVDIRYQRVQSYYQNLPDLKSARLDVYATAADGTVYNVEMQKLNSDNMPKRSRFYQGVLDLSSLASGKTSKYKNLPDSYVIFITEFDVFEDPDRDGRNRNNLYRYTFEYVCRENPHVRLNDGAVKIFLNTKGAVRNGESDLLINFLHYVSESSDENAAADKKLQELHRLLKNMRGDETVLAEYIKTDWAREEGREIGFEEGHEIGLEEGEDRMGILYTYLVRDGRMDDLLRASSEKDFRKELFGEYNI